MSKMRPNISRLGRWIRGVAGLILLLAGLGVCLAGSGSWVWPGAVLIGLGLFALFEATRGWCLARACGIRTRF